MTTISNYLENRMSPAFFSAIHSILRDNPHAIYAPMGPILNPEEFQKKFDAAGIGNQLMMMGAVINPSNIARCMDLYLNEFPFGSGLAILDAMASGMPIISMYNETGPEQGKYGGVYFGLDHVIKTGSLADYINLACELIQDTEKYQVWVKYTLKRYEFFSNTENFCYKFEKIIEHLVEVGGS